MVTNKSVRNSHFSLRLTMAALVLPLALAACGEAPDNKAELAELDDNLTNPTNDPAMKGALEDQILVDPDLADQNNVNAVRGASTPANAAVGPDASPNGSAEGGKSAANAEFSGTGMLSAPAPTVMTKEECGSCGANKGVTLGQKAEQQYARRGKGTCDQKLSYNMGWSNRMPPEFKVYPKARVQEAAGVEGGLCDIRVVSFTTAASMKQVVDYYWTKAKRGGYSAEYVLRDGDHVLGGTRDSDDGAYVITLATRGDGGTSVDIVANNGR